MNAPGPRTFIQETVKAGVFRLLDPDTGKNYYLKRCNSEEVAITSRLQTFSLPDDAVIILPKMLNHETLPAPILEQAKAWVTDEHNKDKTELLLTEAVPHAWSLAKIKKIPSRLKTKPLTMQEVDTMIRDVRILNEAGIFNHDFYSNLFIERDRTGKLRAYAIDFEPSHLGRIHPDAPLEDVAQMEALKAELLAEGLIKKPSRGKAIP